MINFKASPSDTILIDKIVNRILPMAKRANVDTDRADWEMDITACHLNGTPLKLDELLQGDDPNFAHDVFGIRRHIDRHTGKIMDHFLPRFAVTESDFKKIATQNQGE